MPNPVVVHLVISTSAAKHRKIAVEACHDANNSHNEGEQNSKGQLIMEFLNGLLTW